jgi:hypothetical protein
MASTSRIPTAFGKIHRRFAVSMTQRFPTTIESSPGMAGALGGGERAGEGCGSSFVGGTTSLGSRTVGVAGRWGDFETPGFESGR